MPWTADSAKRHTKKAKTKAQRKRWAKVANAALKRGASEASAIRQANAVIAGTAHNGRKVPLSSLA